MAMQVNIYKNSKLMFKSINGNFNNNFTPSKIGVKTPNKNILGPRRNCVMAINLRSNNEIIPELTINTSKMIIMQINMSNNIIKILIIIFESMGGDCEEGLVYPAWNFEVFLVGRF